MTVEKPGNTQLWPSSPNLTEFTHSTFSAFTPADTTCTVFSGSDHANTTDAQQRVSKDLWEQRDV